MKNQLFRYVLPAVFILLAGRVLVQAQYTMPQVLDTATLNQQLDYLEDRTRIYNDYRAIREDMFQKIKKNSQDSLLAGKRKISSLQNELGASRQQTDSLETLLKETREERDEAVRNRDSLSFFGIPMNKILYNTILLGVIAGLAFLAVLLFLMFKGNRSGMVRTRKDLEELREEFEAYRKQSRERYEKLVVSHHQEMKKLKEGKE